MFILWVFFNSLTLLTILCNHICQVIFQIHISVQEGWFTSASFFKPGMHAEWYKPLFVTMLTPRLATAWLSTCPLAGWCWWKMGWVGQAYQKSSQCPLLMTYSKILVTRLSMDSHTCIRLHTKPQKDKGKYLKKINY